jgi:hypothetical protein
LNDAAAASWWRDPAALAPAKLPPRWAHPNETARRHWANLETFESRWRRSVEKDRRVHRELRTRAGRGDRLWQRGDWTIWHHRYAQVLATYANVQTNAVGYWDRGETRPFTLAQLARLVGCPFTDACERRASGAPVRIERLIEDFEAAGYTWRHQGRDQKADGTWNPHVATLKVTNLFWAVSGATGARETFIARIKRRRARAAAAEHQRNQTDAQYKADQQYRRRQQREWHQAAAAARQLAKALADGKGLPPRPRPSPPDDKPPS